MKQQLLLAVILFLFLNVKGQNSFEYIISTQNYEFGYSGFEGDDYYYVLGFIDSSEEILPKAVICKFSDDNDLIKNEITKEDTSSMFFFGTKNISGNLLLVGAVSDSASSEHLRNLYICEMTTELEIISEKYHYFIPVGYDFFMIFDMVIDHDNHIVLAGNLENYEGTTDYCFLIVKLDMDGNLLNHNYIESIHFDGRYRADLLAKQDGSGYYYFNGGSYEWVEFNNDLEFVGGDYKLEWGHSLGDPVTVKYLPDGNLAFVSQSDYGTSYYNMHMQIFTDEFQCILDTVFVEEGRQCPAILKGMDFIDPENIWVVAFNDWIAPTGTEIYKIYIFDSDLNVKGSKYYGGDTRYDFYHLLATQDGGCLLTGNIKQEQGTMLRDIFIKKVMPDDILTGTDEKVFTEFKDVLVYPNPFSNKIFLKTDRGELSFVLYNANGRIVYQADIDANVNNEINTIRLQAGYYIYSITNSNGKAINGGKILKK
jgi:hypothetical protein